ncbi:MAG: dockerin type I repeat-containing protein, partial [Clostridia bacterium]|nr:dockerin type I repeat-containing protein [Clostridia bacterium]
AIDALVKGIKGDVNEDGSVLVVDYMLLKRYCLDTYKLNDAQKARADVNGDGNVTVVDYMLLKRYCLGTYEIK